MKLMSTLVMSLLLSLPHALLAGNAPDDRDALKGISTGKVIFDINMVEAKKMTLYLMVIRQTVDDLKKQGINPDIILAFRGLSVRLISKDRSQMSLMDFEHLDKIAQQIADLQQQGVRVEACSVATKLFNVDNKLLLDGVKPVGNTFVSLLGYQAQGYANIPIY